MKQKIQFHCVVQTPLLSNGANKNHPELRPSSIKGVLRYFWRALHPHLSLAEMKRVEGLLFGSTDYKSPIRIRIKETDIRTGKTPILAHRSPNYQPKNIDIGTSFVVEFSLSRTITISEAKSYSISQLKALFVLASVLGGFGKRSRRGFGSIEIRSINTQSGEGRIDQAFSMPTQLSEIVTYLNEAVYPSGTYFELMEDSIQRISLQENVLNTGYPYLKKILLGGSNISKLRFSKERTEITERIIRDAHDVNVVQGSAYKYGVGAGSPRLASPIYVSSFDSGNRCIISVLHLPISEENSRYRQEYEQAQQAFIEQLQKEIHTQYDQ